MYNLIYFQCGYKILIMDVRKKKIGDDYDYNLVQQQIKNDVKGIIAQKGQGNFSERKGVFVGRSITWNAGSDWWDQIKSYFRSFSSDYANAVREEFFDHLHKEIIMSTPVRSTLMTEDQKFEDIKKLVQNILLIPEEDLPIDKKHVLIADAYEKAFPEFKNKGNDLIFDGEKQKAYETYLKSISFLKGNALRAIDKMARATLPQSQLTPMLDHLKTEHKNDEKGYAVELINTLEKTCKGNIEKLTTLAQNVKMLFEIPSVKRQCGDGKDLIVPLLAEIKAPIEKFQNDLLQSEPNFKKAVQAKFKNIETFFWETGQNIDRFKFYLAKNAIETVAKLCKNEDNFGLLDFINKNYQMQLGFSQEDQDLLQEIVDKHRRYYFDENYGGDKSEIQLRYLQKVFEEEINNSSDREATKNKLLSEFDELMANKEIKLSDSQKTSLKSTLTKKIQQK